MWGKIWKDNHLLKDTVVENDAERQPEPIRSFRLWKKSAMTLIWESPSGSPPMCRSFSATAKPVFRKDSFIEEIPFDYLEIQVIEEDDFYDL